MPVVTLGAALSMTSVRRALALASAVIRPIRAAGGGRGRAAGCGRRARGRAGRTTTSFEGVCLALASAFHLGSGIGNRRAFRSGRAFRSSGAFRIRRMSFGSRDGLWRCTFVRRSVGIAGRIQLRRRPALTPPRSRVLEGAGRGALPGQPCSLSSRVLPRLADDGGLRTLVFRCYYDS